MSARRDIGDFMRALRIALPPAALATWMIARGGGPSYAWWALVASIALSAFAAWALRGAIARRMRTVSAVLSAYRDGDFSIRARGARAGDEPYDDVLTELNALGDTFREHRVGAIEAWALLRKVMAEIDVVVLAFDERATVRLANDAAARLLGRPASALVGAPAASLDATDLLEGAATRIVRDGWELRRGTFRLAGEPHTLVVLSDVSTALRANEREAWRRLIRVMGHEINNSLAPIRSIASSLAASLKAEPRPAEWEDDVAQGLGVIGRRAEALGRFMTAYATLARLPPPRFGSVDVASLVRKTALLEQRLPIEVLGGPDVAVRADADQLEQALINLLKNAVDAASEQRSGGVRVRWSVSGGVVEIAVDDDGPGVSDTANLFVPFFTTKPDGSGIGLVLSRQIVEAHQGQLTLTSRAGNRGAVALVRIPKAASPPTRPGAPFEPA